MKILVVDDDPGIIQYLEYNLKEEGWEVISASSGETAIEAVKDHSPDMILLDIMMPGMDGIEVCRILVNNYPMPIIMLSARGDLSDKVTCLNMGADDYLTKPFELEELIARIKAVARRNQPEESSIPSFFQSDSISIDFESRRVNTQGRETKLTNTENRLLFELVSSAGKTLSYGYLLNKIWGPEYRNEREYLHVYIGHLRAKIEDDPRSPKHIIIKPNVGYCFVADPEETGETNE